MVQFNYNNVTYNIVNHATIKDRLKLRELLELPLEGWKELLLIVNGKIDEESLRQVLIGKVQDMENSKEFEYKGEKLWWNKGTRAGLLNLANSSNNNIKLIINDKIMEIAPQSLKSLLVELEIYSSKVFVITYEHIQRIEKLQTLEDILNYDYTLGYPDKVVID